VRMSTKSGLSAPRMIYRAPSASTPTLFSLLPSLFAREPAKSAFCVVSINIVRLTATSPAAPRECLLWIAAAATQIDLSTPPLLLWQHTLEAASALALKALTLDEAFQPSTRSWTEVAFGRDHPGRNDADLPWNPQIPVPIPGTRIHIRGSIDRLDLNPAADAVRLSDYKTGLEPKQPDQIVLRGGTELQRVIYAAAARHLLPGVRHIVARLLFLGEDIPHPYKLPNVDQAIAAVATHIAAACALLDQGTVLPGPDAHQRRNDHRLALPAAAATYFQLKQSAFSRALGDFSRVWSCR